MIRIFFRTRISFITLLYFEHGFASLSISNENFEIDPEILTCLLNITTEFFRNTNFLVMSEEIRTSEFAKILFQNLRGSLVIQTMENYEGRFGFFLLFPSLMTSYVKMLKQIHPFLYNRFLIVWPTTNNTSGMNEMFAQFWQHRLLNVVIIQKISETSVHAYSYDPYHESSCNDPKLLLVNVWNTQRRAFNLGTSLYDSEIKFRNLNRCKLVCFAKNRPPDSLLVRVNETSWELDGIGGKLMEEVQKRMNFTSDIIVPKLSVSVDEYGYDISQGFPELVSSLLDNSSIDLAFGIYSHIIYDNPKNEFSLPAVSECYGWAVPAHKGKKISAWMYYTQEFQLIVWLLILLEYCIGAGILYLALSHNSNSSRVFRSFSFVILYVFTLTLGMSASPRIRGGRNKLFVGTIILYSMIIFSAYQSSLGSFLTVPWKREQIKTFREILEANYKGIGVPQGQRILKRFSTDNEVLNKLSQRFLVHSDHFESLVKRIQEQKDVVTFGAQRFIQFYINHKLNSTDREEVYLLPKCVIEAHASPFLFKKGSYFLKPINNIVSAAIESGLTNFWYTYSTPKTSSPFAKIHPLTIYQLQFAFVILIAGTSVAILVFLLELQFYRNQRGESPVSEVTKARKKNTHVHKKNNFIKIN